MSLEISSAEYRILGGQPALVARVEGRTIIVDTEWRPTWRDMDAAPLGAMGEDLDAVTLDGVRYRGITKDEGWVAIYRAFWDAANSDRFTEGPVDT